MLKQFIKNVGHTQQKVKNYANTFENVILDYAKVWRCRKDS